MDGPELSIDLDENIHAYKINDMHTGFYRTMYHDKDNLKRKNPSSCPPKTSP
jgi:hypothetical protein